MRFLTAFAALALFAAWAASAQQFAIPNTVGEYVSLPRADQLALAAKWVRATGVTVSPYDVRACIIGSGAPQMQVADVAGACIVLLENQ